MASLSYQIEAYLGRKVDFRSEILLQDDGNGVYIKEWNIEEAKPSQEQLAEYDAQADLIMQDEIVTNNRIKEYGSFGDQLDMMYWDGVNGTTTWPDHISKVKSDNPRG